MITPKSEIYSPLFVNEIDIIVDVAPSNEQPFSEPRDVLEELIDNLADLCGQLPGRGHDESPNLKMDNQQLNKVQRFSNIFSIKFLKKNNVL